MSAASLSIDAFEHLLQWRDEGRNEGDEGRNVNVVTADAKKILSASISSHHQRMLDGLK